MDNETLRQRLTEGLELAKRGDYPAARSVLENLCLEARDSVEAHYYYGLACKRTQDLESARVAWERCLAIDPFHHQARSQLSALGGAGQAEFLSDSGNTAQFFGEEGQARSFQPAPLFSRFLAFFFDAFLFGFATFPFLALFLFYVIGNIGTGVDPFDWLAENSNQIQFGATAVTFAVQLVFIPFYYYESGMTPGKRLLGMRIVNSANLAPLTGVQSVGRYVATYLSSCALYFGYVLAFFNRERRALHDYLAGTVVATSASVPMTSAEKAMTALVILLAVVGAAMMLVLIVFTIMGVMESLGPAPFLPF